MNAPAAARRHHPMALILLLVMSLAVWCPTAFAQEVPAATSPFEDAPALGLADGTYAIDVVLEGGSGRASIATPTTLTVRDGCAAAHIAWSSSNYDYMIVAGKRCVPTIEDGSSVFEIPVLVLDEPFEVIGDTTAMSQPHEITYDLTFASDSMVRQDTARIATPSLLVPLILVLAGAAGVLLFRRVRTS